MDRYYVCKEVAEIYKVKVTTVWDWIAKGKLKAIRIGKQYRIKQEDLEEFEQANRK